MYVQIPANAFYFTLGLVTGIIIIIWLFYVLAKHYEKKQKEKMKTLFDNMAQLDTQTDKKRK